MNQFEIGILDFINEHFSCAFLDKFMPFITRFADGGIFWIILAVVFILIPKTRKSGFSMGLALLFGFLIGNIFLKNVVGRIRPYDVNTDFELIVKPLSDFSFPSGHTLASFEGAVALFVRNKKLGVAALVLATLIAFSRLYLYVHYPTDVLASIILGTAIAILSCVIVDKLYIKFESKLKK